MPRGNKSERRGHRPRTGRRRNLSAKTATQLQLIAWLRYGRPTTAVEEDAVLADLIAEEAARIAPKEQT